MACWNLATSVWYSLIWEPSLMEPIIVTCFCHNSCCLSYVMPLASLYFRKQCPQHIGHAMLSDINISHGSVATVLRCGGICNNIFIANFLLSVTVKEIWKSVIIWRCYGQEFGALFFIGPRCSSSSSRSSNRCRSYTSQRLIQLIIVLLTCCRCSSRRSLSCRWTRCSCILYKQMSALQLV